MGKLVVTNIETQNIKFDSDTTAFTIASDGTTSGVGANIMVLLNTTVVSSGAYELVFVALFSSTYQNYELHGTNVHVSGDGAHIGARILIGGAVKSDSHYIYTRMRIYSGTASGVADMVVGAA